MIHDYGELDRDIGYGRKLKRLAEDALNDLELGVPEEDRGHYKDTLLFYRIVIAAADSYLNGWRK